MGGAVSVAVAVATAVEVALAVAVAVAEAVAVALADASGVVVDPLGTGCVVSGGVVFCGVHAARTAGVSIAALITERTTSLMGERPWYDMPKVYTEEAMGKRRFGAAFSSSAFHATKGSTAAWSPFTHAAAAPQPPAHVVSCVQPLQ